MLFPIHYNVHLIYKYIISLLVLLPLSVLSGQELKFTITGHIRDKYTNKPLKFVNVSFKETVAGNIADSSGNYEINNVKRGTYTIIFSLIGYKKAIRKITVNENLTLNIKLEDQPLLFEPIEITPGTVNISMDEPTYQLSPRQILNTANLFTRDIYRSLQVLPGISNSVWSAKPHIKGGNPD